MNSHAQGVRYAYATAAAAIAVALVYLLRNVLSPVFFALLLAYFLDPAVDRLERAGLPRAAGIVVLLVGALGGLVLFLLLALPTVAADLMALARQLPRALERLLFQLSPWLEARGLALPDSGAEALASLELELRDLAPKAVGPLQSFMRGLVGGTASALGALAGALMVPILAFYLLQDFDRIVEAVRQLLPAGSRASIVAMTREVDTVLGQFVRGQLMVMAILAALYAVGYWLVGVPLALPIGVVAGLLSFIPYVGGGLALGLALLMVALHFTGLPQVLAVVGVYAAIQLLEGFVITPRIVGEQLGLAPIWVLFSLMVGGDLFGFLGVMLALPGAAVIKVFVGHALARYRESSLFTGRPEQDAPQDAQQDFEEEDAPGLVPGRLRFRPARLRPRRPARGRIRTLA
ncbi:MAG: AI-2E family transporter [Myxococcales bacterium]|nr:AI-2E family transporter [Myxococcales bacterium]